MAKDGNRQYLKFQVTPDMMEKLDAWKAISGSTYSNTIRMALYEYLGEKLTLHEHHEKKLKGKH
jgi:hypothetical protein